MDTDIRNETFSKERELYYKKNITISYCHFIPLNDDGESPLKECEFINVNNSDFSLRYSLWHVSNSYISNCVFTTLCRAPFWYDSNLRIENCELYSPKSLRESNVIIFDNCKISSDEFAWMCDDVQINYSSLEGAYAFFHSNNIKIDQLSFKGKYSFQYIDGLTLSNSSLDTKDAFWHTKNAIIKDCVINGEYIGWYSDNLTFINCTIKGTQPFCYCKNLKLVNCKMVNADLAFEYSDVEADLIGEIDSIKNPKSGTIRVEKVSNIILNNSKYKSDCKIIIK